jgi:hypothetical protein
MAMLFGNTVEIRMGVVGRSGTIPCGFREQDPTVSQGSFGPRLFLGNSRQRLPQFPSPGLLLLCGPIGDETLLLA